MYEGEPPQGNPEFIYKKLCIYSYMFKFQSPSKYSSFDAIYLSRYFSTAPNSFWTCQFQCLLVLLPFFVSPLPRLQNISLWGFFHLGKQKVTKGEIMQVEGWGMEAITFLVNCWTLIVVWAGAFVKHPTWNGQTCWKSLQKNFTKAECSLSQQHRVVRWYRWVPRTFT